jgi:motility quorum-sensing regulator/GCU-specific mRNA interferase toxin
MEKRTPHCKLTIVKRLINEGKIRMTASAVTGAQLMGLSVKDMVTTVLALSSADFSKV